MSLPLPATRGILVCSSTNRTLLELTTQTKTQQLPEVYVKDVKSAVLTSILLINIKWSRLSHTTLANSSSSMPSHTTVLEPQDSYMLTSVVRKGCVALHYSVHFFFTNFLFHATIVIEGEGIGARSVRFPHRFLCLPDQLEKTKDSNSGPCVWIPLALPLNHVRSYMVEW